MFKTQTIEIETESLVVIRRKESNKDEANQIIKTRSLGGFKIVGIASGMNPNDHMVYMQKI